MDIGDYYDVAAIAAQEAQIPVRLLHGCTGACGAEGSEGKGRKGASKEGRQVPWGRLRPTGAAGARGGRTPRERQRSTWPQRCG